MASTLQPATLERIVDRLASLEPPGLPVVSLYLDARPDQRGRDRFQAFLRKELEGRVRSYPLRSPERQSLEGDAERVRAWVRDELQPSANGVALFACSRAGLFESLPSEAPYERSELHVAPRPHIYPLMRLMDRYPRYAALLADTHVARLFVFALGARLAEQRLENESLTRTHVGGYSQLLYRSHVDDHYLHHAKDVVDALDRMVRRERIDRVVLAGEEIILPLIRERLPEPLAAKVVDVVRMETKLPEHEVLQATLQVLREREADTEVERVQRMLDQYRAGGLAVVGLRETEAALVAGSVDQLLISADPAILREVDERGEPGQASEPGGTADQRRLADDLVTRARQTGAQVTFMHDAALLADVGGVGALLRYRVDFESGPARLA